MYSKHERTDSNRADSAYSRHERTDSKEKSDDMIQIIVEKDHSHSKGDNRLEKRPGSALTSDEQQNDGHRHYHLELSEGQDGRDGEGSSDRHGHVVPPPPPPPPEPKYNVVELLHQGHTLT